MKIHVIFTLICLLGGVFGFLPTRLNYNDPELAAIFCPEQMSSPSTNLKAITREGIRREIINLFNDDPPIGADPSFNVPSTASLSEMFHQYYGENSSPTRFYSAVNTIAWANADVDSMESTKYDTKYHFDGEQIQASQALLAERHNSIVASLLYNQSYDFARQQIGYSLHAIQDFYSHTNWFELGNTDILEGLGFSGFDIPNIAGEDDIVCQTCSNPDGSCTNNVIKDSGKLTSGYYEYDGIPESNTFQIPKPDGGKCSFGGALDTSRTKTPLGGINKASTSPCFSPHYYSHYEVAEMAIEATQYYLSQIRFAIGNDRFKFLFDLYQGSALVIVIDTTGSMSTEISVVQNQVAIIVDTAPADLYILVPYNDPGYGPVTRTSNSQEFLDAVNALAAGGGGGVLEEMVWSALQLALINTPDYSTLYLFTDAGGYDYELMDGDIAMAQEKNIICTVIFSYSNGAFTGPPYTDDEDYKNLALVTGGDFIEIDDFSIDDVVSIIGDGTDSSAVTLAIRRNVVGSVNIPVMVDDTVSSLQIVISGEVIVGIAISPSSVMYDLTNQTALLEASVTVNAFSTNVIDVAFENPEVGVWAIETASSGSIEYSVFVNGQSTLGYMMEFTEIDSRPPRPNYRLINGQPIAGMTYYAETILVGWIENEVSSVSTMNFIDDKGVILSEVVNTEPVDDEFYIQTEAVPEERFYVGVNGHLQSGTAFTRLYETLITPAVVSVGVNLASSNLASPPGTVIYATFQVYNNGPAGEYDYFVTDDQGYVTDFTPTSSIIESGSFVDVTITLTIPETAIPWTQSTIIMTASSKENSYDVNSDIAYFIVLPEERDTTSPICTTQSVPDCSEYASKLTCDDGTWTATAVITDDESELSSIYTQPSNNDTQLVISDYEGSENYDAVSVTLTASCCVTKLEIIGVDSQGNIGSCSYDMGELDGVLTFEAIEAGPTWILLEWTVSSVRPELAKYRLITDGSSISDINCFETTCHYNSSYLQPCSLHEYQITPYFDEYNNYTLTTGSPAYTVGETTDVVPNPPSNGQVVLSGSTVTISWDPPANDQCIVLYEVCYASTDNDISCITSTGTSVVVSNFYYCRNYSLAITSQTASGLSSSIYNMNTNAVDGVPGPPTNLHIVRITPTTANVSWDAPAYNASCANDYDVNWKETNFSPLDMKVIKPFEIIADGEFWSIVYPLVPCTSYSFSVNANSPLGVAGPESTVYDISEEITPASPLLLTTTTTGTHSIHASWTSGGDVCIDHYLVCYQSSDVSEERGCTIVYGNSHSFNELTSCTLYTISVTAVSPNGLMSAQNKECSSTDDEVPGPPRNLEFVNSTDHTITIHFDAPENNTQCVAEYVIRYTDMNSTVMTKSLEESSPQVVLDDADHTNTIDGLYPCSYYNIEVHAISPQGLSGNSSSTNGSTLEDTPSAPTDVRAQATSTSTILVTWYEPESNFRCATSYGLIWIDDESIAGNDLVETDPGQTQFTYVMSDLKACMSYDINVTPRTDLGDSGTVGRTDATTLCQ